MTDRMKGCWVSFASDIREDDVEVLMNAIRMLRGVAGVECIVTDPDDWMARSRVKSEIRSKILQLLQDLDKPLGMEKE